MTGFLLLVVNDPPRGSAEPELDDVITAEAATRYAFKLSDLPEISRMRRRVLVFHQSIDWIVLAVLYGWSFTWLSTLGLSESAFMVVALLTLGTLIGHAFFGFLGDVLEQRYPDHGRTAMAQVGLQVSLPALTGFILMGSQSIAGLMVFGLLAGLSLSSVDTGARWPIAQAVLRPETRATGHAALDMFVGVVSALAVVLSGLLVDKFNGNVTLMLLLVSLPKLISSILWIPMFRTYPPDRDTLHNVLVQRREEILSTGDQGAGQ